MAGKTRTDGGTRSAVVTVRLDPKLKYLAELAAKKQRRPLSSYVEWAVAESLQKVILAEIPDDPFDRHSLPQSISVDDAEQQHHLWDPDEPDRLVKLALHFPDLLDHEEQVLWKLIRENGALWRGNFDAKGIWRWTPSESSIQFPLLRLHWELFVGVARGEKPHAELPGWKKEGPPAKVTKPKPTPDDFDDEVPF